MRIDTGSQTLLSTIFVGTNGECTFSLFFIVVLVITVVSRVLFGFDKSI